jgi:DEAD/DEAH box helicase domain-containing protein
MSVTRLLRNWQAEPSIAANVATWQNLPARPAQFRPFPPELHPDLTSALESRGITALYSHQAAAWERLGEGRNVVVVTGTASGKTLSYNLPVLDLLLRDPAARSLYIFPTKALAQDQLKGLQELLKGLQTLTGSAQAARAAEIGPGKSAGSTTNASFAPLSPAIYDGDTPSAHRQAIRKGARIVLTNPDMLHLGILPYHTVWAEFFRDLRFIVIDELHVYRGVFGSHVANVIRRLKRVTRFYGARPQFILTSATIANPIELAEGLCEEPTALVDEDGAGRGPKSFLVYNPPVVNRDLGLRRSALQESVRLADDLLAYHIQTIIFGRSRRTVELILTYLRQRPLSTGQEREGSKPGLPPWESPPRPASQEHGSIRGYRSGYLPNQRREIERGLREGEVRAVVATNALELGVDIGGMGASLLVGYPGTIASVWQQAGRAGRGADTSLALLIATADPLDQFLAHHPEYIFQRPPEAALINPDNLLILLDHLRCAAFELPFRSGDGFGRVEPGRLQEFLDFLQETGSLHLSGGKYFWMADEYPAQAVSLRSASADNIVLQVEGEEGAAAIGQVDLASAMWMVHPQAVYLHEAQTHLVDELDLEGKVAHLRRLETDYYTEPRIETTVQLLEKHQEEVVPGAVKAFGELNVTAQVMGFRKVKWYTHEQLGLGDLELPPSELITTGYWLALAEDTVDRLRSEGLWRNDPNQYGPNWRRQRDLARQRDGYRCQVCGAPEDGRQHDVHHKTPFRTFDSLEQANRLENLATLCPACHRRVEAAVRVRSGLGGLAFALGHLAPLFLMCDVGDLGVHSDPQSPLAGGQPAVVLYDRVPAGIGFSLRLYEIHLDLLARAHELVAACECLDGCPSCVGPGGENGLGGKRETLAILQVLTSQTLNGSPSAVPFEPAAPIDNSDLPF